MDEIVSQSLNLCFEHLNKTDTKVKIENDILNPIIAYIGNRLWPYIMSLILFISILLCCLFYLIYIVKRYN